MSAIKEVKQSNIVQICIDRKRAERIVRMLYMQSARLENVDHECAALYDQDAQTIERQLLAF